MSAKNSILILAFFFIYLNVKAGIHDSGKRFYLSEVLLSGGSYGQTNPAGSLENFQKLAPGSTLLKQNYSGFFEYGSNGIGEGNPMLMLGIGFRSNRQNNGPAYRFVIGLGNITFMEGLRSAKYRFRIDTVTSSQTGEQIFIDSTVYETYHFSHYASILKLDVSVVWRTSAKHKMRLFAGIGCFAGSSLFAKTLIEYNKYDIINNPSGTHLYKSSSYNIKTSEMYHQKAQSMAALYCPFGLDYQVGRKSRFWKKLNLFLELRAQVYYKKIPELEETIKGGLQMNMGIRYALNQK